MTFGMEVFALYFKANAQLIIHKQIASFASVFILLTAYVYMGSHLNVRVMALHLSVQE